MGLPVPNPVARVHPFNSYQRAPSRVGDARGAASTRKQLLLSFGETPPRNALALLNILCRIPLSIFTAYGLTA